MGTCRGWRGKSTGVSARPSPTRIQAWLTLAWLALVLCCYRQVMGHLFQQWHSQTSYSHGPAVLPIAIWLLWQRRSTLPAIGKPWGPGLALLLAAQGFLWLGGYFHLPTLQCWTLPLYLCGMVGLLAGREVLGWSLPAIGFLGFMIPLPFQLELLANQSLQWLSAWCSCYLLSLTSTFAVTDGYTLMMATGGVGITKDCSGLRMTVAVVALGTIITFLARSRSDRDRGGPAPGWSVVRDLATVMLLAVPAAILANAARISVVAWVADRYQTESYTRWAHDLGDWLALPLSALLFLAFRAWISRTRALSTFQRGVGPDGSRRSATVLATAHEPSGRINPQVAIRRLRGGDRDFDGGRCWAAWGKSVVAVGAVPLVIAGIVAVAMVHHAAKRERIIRETLTEARVHEANADWDGAAMCYRTLLQLQPEQIDARYRYAWASLQGADSVDASMQAFYQLESVLEQAPSHVDALRTHLELALDLDQAKSASRSAERLYGIDRRDAHSLRLCVEAMLRFPHGSGDRHPLITVDRLNRWMERFGPTSQWRDRLVIEVASYCCDHAKSMDRRVTSAIEPAIADAADGVGSTYAFLQAWRYAHVFGTGTPSIERARLSIDNQCPAGVAYRIYLASAQEAVLQRRRDDAKRFLTRAIERLPNHHAAYAILGDVFASQGQWPQCTAAYLRAWRLVGDRPMGLGIKLAEALFQAERYAESAALVGQLLKQENQTLRPVSRDLRIRWMLVQAGLDARDGRHERALETIGRCRSLIAMSPAPSADEAAAWLPALETLQARCLVRLGRYAQAATLFESRAADGDRSADGDRAADGKRSADQWTAAARAWRSDGNLPAAERCYRSALSELGYDNEIWLELVDLLRDRYGVRGALEEIALRQRRGGATAAATQRTAPSEEMLAQAYERVGRGDLAIRHYRTVAERGVEDVAALAIALARHGHADKAVALVSDPRWTVNTSLRAHTAAVIAVSTTEWSPADQATLEPIIQRGVIEAVDDPALLMAIVAWHTHHRRKTAALELLDRAVTRHPDNVVAANNLAMRLAEEGRDLQRALRHIDDVLKQTGPVSEFLDTKGWILVQMDRAEDALVWFRRAVAGPGGAAPTTHLHMAAAYLAVGNRDQARESYQSVQVERLHVDQLHHSEQRAWARLQSEFTRPNELTTRPPLQRSGEA
ncbi:Transmembrane exosortase [Stieleria neptunia]|uniref:Transmembrane exosortase n=1 Tax=Stieleria neptunia TaxID=2527979 RepID=A0A518HJC5_9BACT|nr:archaeosortase/exosortase family protein [Stieleria neptunia]QDV40957.1 Transmembrane exosortase [Stieleria neptunia]